MSVITEQEVVSGIVDFGITLLKTGIPGTHNGIIGNHSVASVLALTLLGSDGNTAEEIRKALVSLRDTPQDEFLMPSSDEVEPMDVHEEVNDENGYEPHRKSGSRSSIKKSMKKIIRNLSTKGQIQFEVKDEDLHKTLFKMFPKGSEPTKYILRNANKLYINKKKSSVSKGYIAAVEQLYGFRPELLDFAGHPEKSRHEINYWVEQQTESKIKEIIPEGTIDRNTSIIIVNAIYFKGVWANQFNPDFTSKKVFNLTDGKEVSTDFMFQNHTFPYKEDYNGKYQVLELPYIDQDLSFVVVLPKTLDIYLTLEKSINSKFIQEVTKDLTVQEIDVYLPKFKIEIDLDLSSVLGSLGIQEMFIQQKANLTGIDPSGYLYVSKLIHKAFIEVNEEGSEAAAATGEVVRAASSAVQRLVFNANRPFFFFVKNNAGAILFLGKFCEPAE